MEENAYCDTCAKKHDQEYGGNEVMLSIANLPRAGIDGYTGDEGYFEEEEEDE